MANLGQQFNRADMPADEFSPLPKGDYTAIISNSEMVAYKSGNGQYLKLTYEIVDGDKKGRKVFDNMNISHPTSQKAVEIAWSQMGKIMDAVGLVNIQDSNELHNKPINISVEIDGEYNRIKKWSAMGNTPRVVQTPSENPDMGQANNNAAPWS